jgi:hypothetical protein
MEVLGRMGQDPVRLLVLEALNRKNTPAHRVRLLQTIELIGGPFDLETCLDLSVLLADPNTEVKRVAQRLCRSRPGVSDEEPVLIPFRIQL